MFYFLQVVVKGQFPIYRYGISGFPTLKFFPKGNKDGEDYEGGRDVDDFVNFINEKAGTNRDAKGHLTVNVSNRQCLNFMFFFYGLLKYVILFVGWYSCKFGIAGERVCSCWQ